MAQVTGQQITFVTLGWLAFHLTGSPLALGVINLLTAAPRIGIGLVGGVLADRIDPRSLIAAAQAASATVLLTLAALTVTERIELWHLAVGALLLGFVQSFDEPSRASLFPRLLPDRSLLQSAVPLISVAWSSTRIVAPSIAGFVIAAAGAGTSFFLAACGAAVMAAVMPLVRPRPLQRRTRGTMFGDLKAGASYVWEHAAFRPLVILAFVNSAFGQGYMLTLPVFQADVLNVDPRGLGLMYSMTGVGSMAGLFLYARTLKNLPAGRLQLGSTAAFAVGLLAFAASPWFPLSLIVLFYTGMVGVLQITNGQVIIQTLVVDELRGRVMALHGLHWSLLPVGGAVINGGAEFIGAPMSLGAAALIVLFAAGAAALRSVSLRRLELGEAKEPAGAPARAG